MSFYFVIGAYGLELTLNRWDILVDARTLFSFRIFGGSFNDPWFAYRIQVLHGGILSFHLGHGKLRSTWIAQGPIKRVA